MTPNKLCECGCGAEAGFYKKTSRFYGQIKGHPKRFIHGHNPAKAVFLVVKCLLCGKDYNVKPCYLNKSKYCSRSCATKNLFNIHPEMRNRLAERLRKNPLHTTPHTLLSRLKMSNSQRNKKMSQEYIEKMVKLGKASKTKFAVGHKLSKESIEKIREARVNQKMPTKRTSIEEKISDILSAHKIQHTQNTPLAGICIPDIFIRPNIVVFCDGDYWHNLPGYFDRDNRINKKLTDLNYKVIRLWEHEINQDINSCLHKIQCHLM